MESQDERRARERAETLTAESLPLGTAIEGVEGTTTHEAIQSLRKSQIAGDDAVAVSLEALLEKEAAAIRAQIPTSYDTRLLKPVGLQASADRGGVGSPIDQTLGGLMPFYFDEEADLWLSTDTATYHFGRNSATVGAAENLRLAANGIEPVVGEHGYAMPFAGMIVHAAGRCDTTGFPALDPQNTGIAVGFSTYDGLGNALLATAGPTLRVLWPNSTPSWSAQSLYVPFGAGDQMYARIDPRGTPSNTPNRPSVQIFCKWSVTTAVEPRP